MKIEKIERISDDVAAVTFSRDGHSVTKNLWFGGAIRATGCKQSRAFAIQRAAREADRDIAYKLHGDKYREHCTFKSNFWDWMTASELDHLKVAELCK